MSNEVQYRVFDFSGGLASNISAELQNDNEAKDALNLVYGNRGHLKKRSGLKIHNSLLGHIEEAGVKHNAVMIYSYSKPYSGKEETIIVYENSKVKGYDGTDVYDFNFFDSALVATPFSLGTGTDRVIPTFFVFNDNLYILDPKNGAFKYTGRTGTGTGSERFVQVNGIPKTSMALVRESRVYYAGDPTNPHILYYSQILDAESIEMTRVDPVTGTETEDGGGGAFSTISEDAAITGLTEFNGYIIILKEKSAFTISGKSKEDFVLSPLNVATGCIAPRTVVRGNNMVYWLSKEGVYYLTSPQNQIIRAEPLSVKVNDQIPFSDIDALDTYAYFDGKRFMLVPNYKKRQNMLIYDEVNTIWTKFDFAPTAIDYSPKARDTFYVVGENVSTLVEGQLKDELTPGVYTPIHSLLTTAFYRLGKPEVTKRFRSLMVFLKPNSVEDSTVKMKVEIDYKDSYRSIDAEYISMQWGTGQWDNMYWGEGKDEVNQLVRFGGTGKMIRFTFENNSVDEDMEIHGFVINYKEKRRIR